MPEITISILCETPKHLNLQELMDCNQRLYFPTNLKMTYICVESEWIAGKTKITMKGEKR